MYLFHAKTAAKISRSGRSDFLCVRGEVFHAEGAARFLRSVRGVKP